MEVNFNPNDRGQVGIGTLIVFIAMVLVAAIAAGVLINTAGFLQTQAEDTGTESTEQVATNLNVITTVGDVSSSGDTVDELRLGVQPAAGSDDLNLEEVSVQYVSANSFSNLVHVQESDVNGAQTVFNTEPVTAEDGTDNVMTESSDRYEIVVPLADDRPFTQSEVVNPGTGSEAVYKIDVAFNAEDSSLSDIAGAFDSVDSSDFTEVEATTGNYDNAVLFDASADGTTFDGSESTLSTNSGDLNGVSSDEEVRRAVAYVSAVEVTELEGYEDPVTTAEDGDGDGSTADFAGVTQEFYDGVSNNGNQVNELVEGEEAELTFTTESGAQTVTILQVPDSLAGEDEDDTVDL